MRLPWDRLVDDGEAVAEELVWQLVHQARPSFVSVETKQTYDRVPCEMCIILCIWHAHTPTHKQDHDSVVRYNGVYNIDPEEGRNERSRSAKQKRIRLEPLEEDSD